MGRGPFKNIGLRPIHSISSSTSFIVINSARLVAKLAVAVKVVGAMGFAVVIAVAVAFAVPAAATDVDAAKVVDAGGVASGTAARAEGRNRCCTNNIM